MPSIRRGEVWLVDLGMTAKVRPAVIFNTPYRATNVRSLPLCRTRQLYAEADLKWQ